MKFPNVHFDCLLGWAGFRDGLFQAIMVGGTRPYNSLTSIMLGNHPNGMDHTRKPEKTG